MWEPEDPRCFSEQVLPNRLREQSASKQRLTILSPGTTMASHYRWEAISWKCARRDSNP